MPFGKKRALLIRFFARQHPCNLKNVIVVGERGETFLFLLDGALFTASHCWLLDPMSYKYPLTILNKGNSNVAMCRILSWGLFSIAIKGVLFVSSHFLQWFKDQSCFTAVLPLKVYFICIKSIYHCLKLWISAIFAKVLFLFKKNNFVNIPCNIIYT